jgi:2-polyprenyl-6-methoxyphenol hydroxylase-like FAD-dependent oxidoreductase
LIVTQVIVVGAGPTGVTLALLLAQRGIKVQLVESAAQSHRMFRGEALMPNGCRALSQMGLAEVVTGIPHQSLSAWEVVIENQSLFRVDEPMEINGQPCTLLSQTALLPALIAQANTYPNFEFLAGTKVQDLLWDNNMVESRTDRPPQRVVGVKLAGDRILTADLVIGCDGRNSQVRAKANLPLVEQPQDFNILWFKMADFPTMENVFYSFVKGENSFGVFRGATGQLQMGWSLHIDDPIDWKTADWPEILAAAAPPWLAAHFRSAADSIEKPVLLSVVVGSCPRWHIPGLLLLGDAAHPMSPIRAQGINMALRDVIVAANYLVPALQDKRSGLEIDRLLAQIQADREPEIEQVQALQQAEFGQAKLLRKYPLLRQLVSRLAPVLGQRIKKSWLIRQQTLRQGFTVVNLKV